ncbi:MAG: hypothetical protein WBC51_12840 [Vicinamibacterales bacterium]
MPLSRLHGLTAAITTTRRHDDTTADTKSTKLRSSRRQKELQEFKSSGDDMLVSVRRPSAGVDRARNLENKQR